VSLRLVALTMQFKIKMATKQAFNVIQKIGEISQIGKYW
jgi:hypothetical protein